MASGTIKGQDVYLTASQNAWSGSTLKFNISANNLTAYHFIAISSIGKAVESIFIVRTDVGAVWINLPTGSNTTASATYSNGVLTITLPETAYWLYQVERLHAKM